MKRNALLLLLLLFLAVPWGFSGTSRGHFLGMPYWAAYALGVSILLAGFTARLLWKDDHG